MVDKPRNSPQTTLFGCGLPALILGLILFVVLVIAYGGQAGRYPDAEVIPALTQHTIRPFFIRSERVYRSEASFTEVQIWYEDRFEQTAEKRDVASGCVVLEGAKERFSIERYIFVTICENLDEQKIFVAYSLSVENKIAE